MKHIIQAGKFKAECLHIMEMVKSKGMEFIITKRNVPIAKLTPIENRKTRLFGKMKGSVHIKADVTEPIDEKWDADS